MRIGVPLPLADGDTADGHVPTFDETASFARHAEAAGLDSIWGFDHLLFRFAGEAAGGVRGGGSPWAWVRAGRIGSTRPSATRPTTRSGGSRRTSRSWPASCAGNGSR